MAAWSDVVVTNLTPISRSAIACVTRI